jgi:isoquinoline 1-oxidoreductase beta subunit
MSNIADENASEAATNTGEQRSPERSRAAKWTRRGFIGAGAVAGGALLIGVGVRPGNPVDKLGPLVAGGTGDELVNSWVKIGADNVITAIVPHCEMGQGVHSVLAQMLADELDADWNLVKVMQAPTDGSYVVSDTARLFVAPFTLNAAEWIEPTWDGLFTQIGRLADVLITGGSSSIRSTGQYQMRIAGAAAKSMLVGAAAEAWDVPREEITTRDSMLFHDGAGKSAPYAEFAAAAAEQTMPSAPDLKKPEQYRLMGKDIARSDIPAKVNGTAKFGIDAAPEGLDLSYAAVRRVPVRGSKITEMKAEAAKTMPGVLQILNMGDFAAVVADGYWQASQALAALELSFSEPESDIRTTADQFARMTAALDDAGDDGGDTAASKGDAAGTFSDAETQISAEYKVPYLAHAPMEPVNCTAYVHGAQCDIWTSTQVPLMARSAAAAALGIDADAVTIHHPYLGGAFGRRLESDYVTMAARLAKATGYPIKMIWSREEDTRKAAYRPADISRFKGALDADGRLVSYNNVFTQRHDPAEASVPSMYDIPNTLVRTAEAELLLPFSAWRSVDHSQHGFFIESFIDEAAHAAGKDPLEFRKAMLSNAPRHLAVLDKVAEMSGWGAVQEAGPEGVTYQGVAIVESFGTIVAQVAGVNMSSGKPKVTKIWAAADAGYVMNPDGFRNQIEGGIVFALTAAMYGKLDLVDGAVQQSNFHDYKMLRMDESPDIEIAIINSGDVPIGGAGEPGVPPAAPAVTNAIFAATGKRLRELPIADQFA